MELKDVVIETARVLLRPIEIKYASEIFDSFTDEITLYMYPKPSENIGGVIDFIMSSIKSMEEGSNLQFVIIEKTSTEFLGCCGLHNIGKKDPELGVWIRKNRHGNKYGLEAITSMIHWARNNIQFEYLRYPVDKRNYASRKIPIQNGGVIKREFKSMSQKGFELDQVEYWIYK